MSRKAKTILFWSISVILGVAGILLATRLLEPKYMSGVIEGAMISEYYDEVKDHDVIMVADCELYENVSPAVLWEEYGINSYIRGSAQQLIWQSYYLLEDTFRYETPKVVVFNVESMMHNEPQKETYNRMTLDGMKWSLSKVKSIRESMTQEEHFIEYVFPILRYHSRYSELTGEDFSYYFDTDKVTHNGYYMRVDVMPVTTVPKAKPLADYRFGDRAYEYLDKIVALCEEYNVQLLLVKAPSLYPVWYDEWDAQIVSYAEEHHLTYVNFLNLTEEIGLDYTTDTYDAGLHLNLSGAEKMARALGDILTSEYGLVSRKDDPALAMRWEEKLEAYYADRDAQLLALGQ